MNSKIKVKKINLIFNNFLLFKIEEQENEEEEKPVMPQTSETSEEVHGGQEITESIEDSENWSEEIDNTNSENEAENLQENIQVDSDSEDTQETTEDSSSEEQAESSDGSSTQEETSSSENEKNAENEYEDEDCADKEYSDDYSEEQEYSYQWNAEQVVVMAGETEETISTKYLQTEFYRFIERFSEDKLKIKSHDDFDDFDIKKLMFRQFERKPLNAYRCTRIRDTVILILDNSGSMTWWTENLRILSAIALNREDVEVYIAPNGYIEEQLIKRGRIAVNHEKVMTVLQGRRIIYIGDYDGADTPIELSWRNDVIWICPEDRYRRFLSHSWVSYDESAFRGVFIRAYDIKEMFKGFRMTTRLYRHWIDLHEQEVFEDD